MEVKNACARGHFLSFAGTLSANLCRNGGISTEVQLPAERKSRTAPLKPKEGLNGPPTEGLPLWGRIQSFLTLLQKAQRFGAAAPARRQDVFGRTPNAAVAGAAQISEASRKGVEWIKFGRHDHG